MIDMTHTADGGELVISDGRISDGSGVETAMYLSMFMGEWWGDAKSSTQEAIDTLPPSAYNLQLIKKAVEADLSWIEGNHTVDVTIPTIDKLLIQIDSAVSFEIEWGGDGNR